MHTCILAVTVSFFPCAVRWEPPVHGENPDAVPPEAVGGVVLEDAQGDLVGAVLVGDGGAVRVSLDPEPESEMSSAGSGVVPEDVVWIDHPVGRRCDVRVEKAERPGIVTSIVARISKLFSMTDMYR